MNSAVKIGLLGAGAYLLITKTSIFANPAATPGSAPGPAGGAAPPAGTGGSSSPPAPQPPPAPPVPVPAPVIDPAAVSGFLAPAANGNPQAVAIVRTANVRMNSDLWNWYRNQGGGGATTVDLFPAGNRDYQMSIDEYLAARAGSGLSGLERGR